MKKRQRIAIAIGAVVLVVGVVAGRERPALDLVQGNATERAARVAADDGIDLDKLRRGESAAPKNDPFKGFGSPKAAAQAGPAKPVAPPLPFQYFGKLIDNGKREVFVMRGEELLSIEAGKTYGDYRVDSVADARISFTYLPLRTKQTLDIQ